MDSVQIDRLLRPFKIFRGVDASDRLPKSPQNGVYIVNLDPSNLPGSHCVGIYLDNHLAEYFDSYGLPPFGANARQFLKPFVFNYNRVQIQSFQSDICGEYCCLYAVSKSLGYTLHKFLNQFHRTIPHLNDCRALKLFRLTFNRLRRARCHPRAQRCCSRINTMSGKRK
jgi:hypothetical protein